tara:strand:- start:3206 stop:3496 length:291 start_codon:yes stop_codon:yes gene_type:complete
VRINLTKKDIVNSIYMQIGYSKKVSETLLEEFFNILLNSLIHKKTVKISKFGTFFLKQKKQRIGRNPKTKKEAVITARNVISFKASKELKKFINEI